MKVLFVGSGNHGKISPIIKSQGDSLASVGVETDYFLIKGKGLKGYLRQVKPLKGYVKKNHFDVIHAHYSLSAFAVSLTGARRVVVSLMGSDVKATKLYKLLIRVFARFFHWEAIIVKSEDMYKDLQIKRAKIVPNGVDLDLFKPMDKTMCCRNLGWNTEKKHVLFPANPSRSEKDFDLAQKSIGLMGGNVEIHVFEQVEHQKTPLFYNASDSILLTSKWEGSPNVIKEAMVCGCPIVSTDVGDVKERVDGVAGCYVAKTREPKELADLLRMAMAFDGKTKGREKVVADGLDNKQIAEELMRIYSHILQKK